MRIGLIRFPSLWDPPCWERLKSRVRLAFAGAHTAKPHHLAWLAGLIGLPLAHYWLLAKVEPFYSSIYCFLWWFYIFVADFFVFLLRGQSLLRDRPREFLFLSIWSVPVWLLFEMVNLRLENWYYVMSPYDFSVGLIFLVLAFGTVLPGLFVTAELVIGLIEKFAPGAAIKGPPLTIHRWNIGLQLAIGIVMLLLLLLYPKNCFCLAWGFAFFLADPICYWLSRKEPNHQGRSLLGQLAAGDNTRLVALLVAGFICGGLWEAWNLHARTKWIYSVPFFDEIKLGEMPVLGFLGFPPFALECYALVNLLGLLRGGRNWELSATENRVRPGMSRRTFTMCCLIMPLGILIADFASQSTVRSYSLPLDYYFSRELGEQGITALRNRDALQGDRFLMLKERPPEIDPGLYARMRRIATMGELKGMGLAKALALEKLNIVRPDDLAAQNPTKLAEELKRLGLPVRLEEVKVWIRAAQRSADIHVGLQL